MLKKISKAVILAMSAFMVAFLPACSSDDDDNKSGPETDGKVAVSNVKVTAEESVLYITEEPKTATFVATVSPDNATDKTVYWSVSGIGDGTLSATTGENVSFTATKAGSVTLMAQADGQNDVAPLTVYVDKYSEEVFKNLSKKEHVVDGMWVRIGEDGIVSIDEAESDVPATVEKVGEQTKLTATIDGEDYTLTVSGDKLTLETTAEPAEVTLRKFGTSVVGADLTAYTDFGLNEVLMFDEPITPEDGVFASITATIKTKGKNIGVGFVSFRDGAYNDGVLDGMVFMDDQKIDYKKDYSLNWNSTSWDDTATGAPISDNPNGSTYIMSAKLEGKAFSLTIIDEETSKEYTYNKSDIGSTIPSSPLYLAIGGRTANAGETLDITRVTINTPKVRRGQVVDAVDLLIRMEVPYTVNKEKAVYRLTGTGNGQKATIAKEDLPRLSDVISIPLSGELSWDSDVQIASTDWDGDTAIIRPTFTFLPTAQNQYAALFSKEVEIIVTDARTVDTNSGDISWFSDIKNVSLAARNDDSNGLVTGGNAEFFYKGTESVSADEKIRTTRTIVTGVAYKPISVSFNPGDVVMKYELPFTVGDSAVVLTGFSYAWGCGGTRNFNGQVSILTNDNTVLYQQSEETEGNGDVGIQHESDDTFSVPVSANTAGKVVITIKLSNKYSYEKDDYFIIAKSVLDFKKR